MTAAATMQSAKPACPADYGFLRQIVQEHSHNVLDPAQDYLFETRLAKLLRSLQMAGVEELVWRLRARRDAALERAVAEAMTVNETSFFRDARPFELLEKELLPGLIKARREARSLRLWSAACSTGQEAYSLAMLIADRFPVLAQWDVRVEATDISAEVIERAQQGRYSQIEIRRGLAPRLVARYFERDKDQPDAWTVRPELRRLCHFRQANLCGPCFPFLRATDRFDVILLRNVMLYMAPETRRALLVHVHRVLAPDGVLFLGSSEQPADMSQWTAVLAGGACYYRRISPPPAR
ncbi:MAG TPA: protein-glutamate O-methyltransferase CheR [Terracidiphilus sp.]|nr:protein-glutamate O-methyltransferase CheR [Terracidiphilus sp.]